MSQENEILVAAREAKAAELGRLKEVDAARARRWRLGTIGVGVGIGSAAVAAAMLYARREPK